MFLWNEAAEPFGPLDDECAFSEHRVKVEFLRLGHRVEPVGVEMEKLSTVGTPILIDEDKRRAGNRVERAPSLRQTLREGGLARAKIALQTDHISRFEQTAKPHPDAACLLGAAAEKLDHVRVEDGHRAELYPYPLC